MSNVRPHVHELSPSLLQQVQALAAEGDALAAGRKYKEAIAVYNQAWSLVPEPKNEWEASTWLLGAIGDACFLDGYFTSWSEAFSYALHCPRGLGNPFVHLRLGQCEFELQHIEAAVEHLARAYALEGAHLFASEDPKYLDFLKTRIERPASGEW